MDDFIDHFYFYKSRGSEDSRAENTRQECHGHLTSAWEVEWEESVFWINFKYINIYTDFTFPEGNLG